MLTKPKIIILTSILIIGFLLTTGCKDKKREVLEEKVEGEGLPDIEDITYEDALSTMDSSEDLGDVYDFDEMSQLEAVEEFPEEEALINGGIVDPDAMQDSNFIGEWESPQLGDITITFVRENYFSILFENFDKGFIGSSSGAYLMNGRMIFEYYLDEGDITGQTYGEGYLEINENGNLIGEISPLDSEEEVIIHAYPSEEPS